MEHVFLQKAFKQAPKKDPSKKRGPFVEHTAAVPPLLASGSGPFSCFRIVPRVRLYAGADGTLDDIDKMMMKYDADCTGSFSIAEVKTIIHDLEASKSASKNLGRALAGTVIVMLAVIGALIGMMIMSIEVTK